MKSLAPGSRPFDLEDPEDLGHGCRPRPSHPYPALKPSYHRGGRAASAGRNRSSTRCRKRSAQKRTGRLLAITVSMCYNEPASAIRLADSPT